MIKTKEVIFGIFSVFSIMSLFSHVLKYQGQSSIIYILLAIITNLVLALFFVSVFDTFKSKGFNKISSFIVYFFLIFFTFIYIGGITSYLSTNYFWTFSGIIFFWITRTTFSKVIILFITFILASAFILLSIREEIKIKIPKIKKLVFLGFLVIVIFLVIPSSFLLKISPITDLVYPLIQEKGYNIPQENYNLSNDTYCEPLIKTNSNLSRPNVIFFMLEAISSDHMGYAGYPREITPNIDELAKKSIVFENAYSSASHSDLAQPAILTSRYSLFTPIKILPLYKEYPAVFFWDEFKNQGYNTSYFSSQNDEWLGMLDFYNTKNLDEYSYSLTDGLYDYGIGRELKDYDETTVAKAINWLNQTKNQSFSLLIELQATHYPYSYPKNNSFFTPDNPSIFTTVLNIIEKDINASKNKYDNSLRYVDKNIGEILKFLEDNQLMNNTIVIITSDHGEDFIGSHGYYRHGLGIYNQEVKVPMLFFIPGEKQSNITQLVKHIDIIPTLFNIINFSASNKFQGRPFCDNATAFFLSQNAIEQIGLVNEDIKYIINLQSYKEEAYNLTKDPEELNNILDLDKNFGNKYHSMLLNWYNCQLDYYQKANWSDKIACG